MRKSKYTESMLANIGASCHLDDFRVLDDPPGVVIEVEDKNANIEHILLTPEVACAYYLHRIAKHLEGGE